MAVAPAGDAVAFRAADGRLAVIGRGRNAFSAEQWLRADADGRLAAEALTKANCDKLGCVGYLASGRTVALDLDTQAFAEDCTRADIIVTPRFAPLGCAAAIVIDREKLKQTGALTLAFAKDGVVQMRAARAADEDRPWSPAPKRGWGRALPLVAAAKDGQNQDASQEPEHDEPEDPDTSPLD
jgi:competence protein ComEC